MPEKTENMPEKDSKNLEEKLRGLLETIEAADSINDPFRETIENLLKTSSAVLNSKEASVLVKDGQAGDLKFLCAIGEVADQIVGLKIPAGKGIAGFVFSSGQPLAVTDAGEEESFYAEVDRQTGFSTRTILATPLIYEGVSIGVLEYVNRVGAPPFEAFSPEEMNTASIYADAIAGIVSAHQSAGLLRNLSRKILFDDDSAELEDIRKWLVERDEAVQTSDLVELAVLVQKVSSRGAAERRLCLDVLKSFVEYADAGLNSDFENL